MRLAIRFLFLIGVAGCLGQSTPHPVRTSARVIGERELAGSTASDLLVLIQRARPHWLSRNPQAVDVYVLDSRLGGLLELRSYRPHEVESVEYLTVADASFRLPDARGKPAIVIIPRER